jgi:hypothetical protein
MATTSLTTETETSILWRRDLAPGCPCAKRAMRFLAVARRSLSIERHLAEASMTMLA